LLCSINAKNLTENQNYPSLRLRDIETIKIPLPPLEVQEKIVAEIDGFQKIIDGARQIVENYKPTIKINPAWPIVQLGELCNYIGSGITPLGGKEVYLESGILFIRSQNVLWGSCDFSDAVFISKKQHDEMIRSAVKKYDVLLNITGASIGRCAVYSSEELANVNQHVVALRCIEKKINPYYLMLNMLGEKIQTHIWNIQSRGTRQALNYKQIREFPISLPPVEAQKEIVAQIESEQKIVNENKKLIEIFGKKISDCLSALWS